MKIKKDWWKGFFNEIYLITDQRTVCNPALTRREVNLLEKALSLDKNDRILDLCGGYGRHSLELARCGYRDLTVLDLSNYLIKLGRRMAREENLKVRFLCRDARFSGLKNNGYSAIFVMANSFGYSPNDKENLKVLRESHRLLKKEGKLLLDLADPDYLKSNLKPVSWHEADKDIIVCRERTVKGDIVKAREIVVSRKKGLLRDGYYCERLYRKKKIERLLKTAGFKDLSVKKNLSFPEVKKDYGLMTSRIFVTARKP